MFATAALRKTAAREPLLSHTCVRKHEYVLARRRSPDRVGESMRWFVGVFFSFRYYCVLDSEEPPFPCPWCLSGLQAALTRAPAGYRGGGTEGAGRGSQRASDAGNNQAEWKRTRCRERRDENEGVKGGKSVCINKIERAAMWGKQVGEHIWGQRNPGKYQPSVSLPPPIGPITLPFLRRCPFCIRRRIPLVPLQKRTESPQHR